MSTTTKTKLQINENKNRNIKYRIPEQSVCWQIGGRMMEKLCVAAESVPAALVIAS